MTSTPPEPRPDEPGQWEARLKAFHARAKQAWDSGRTFHVERVKLSSTDAGHMGGSSEKEEDDAGGVLQVITSVGWVLQDCGYVYQTVRERSHMLTDSAQIEGHIIGVYTFIRPGPEPGDDG